MLSAFYHSLYRDQMRPRGWERRSRRPENLSSILDGGLIVRDMCCHVIGPAQSSHMCEMTVIAM
jgi:hypothetical protein